MKKFGIDISVWQKGINLSKAKNEGVKFAILRGMYGNEKDTEFETYYKNAKAIGLDVGVYQWGRAANVAQAREANRLLESNIIAQQAAQQYFSGTEISNLLSMIVSNNTSIKDNEEMQISVTVEASNWDGENKPDGKIVNEDFDSPNMESFYNVEYTKDEATELINQIIITDAE